MRKSASTILIGVSIALAQMPAQAGAPPGLDGSQLRDVFERLAPVVSARVMGDKCYGFVTFRWVLHAAAPLAPLIVSLCTGSGYWWCLEM